MKKEHRLDYIERYEKRLHEFGYSPQTLGWGVHGRQEIRFSVLAEHALRRPESSVLDVGCGFCDLWEFLRSGGWRGHYTGIDIVPGLLEVARQRQPTLDIREGDITDSSFSLDEYDFVIASGIFNGALPGGGNELHIEAGLKRMFEHCRMATCVDFLTTNVDFKKPGAHHTDPAWARAVAKTLSRRVVLREDYMPFEFSIFLFRDDSISERNVYRRFENDQQKGSS
ncbi:MAG TPA: class I SAM-dependent methyltransferase [Dongiaceae bacterium]|nr:class I SAM-dependent methyltransferase [Dongiaceae bacterium]